MANFVEALQERTAALRAPIPGDRPSGTDISFDPDFERVKGELDKLTGLSGAQPNWRDIIETSEKLLSSKSKDMRIATWLTVAKMNQNGWSGFAEALAVYQAMIKDHWDTMFPEVKRARGRANLYTWLGDQVAAYFEAKEVTSGDGDAVKACDEMLTQIDQMLGDKLGDLHPGPGKLRGLMRDKVRAIPAEAPPPAPAAEATPSAGASAAAPAPPPMVSAAPAVEAPAAAASPDDALRAIRSCGEAIVASAKLMRRADPALAWPYRAMRIGTWIGVVNPPPNDSNKTRIPAPPAAISKKMETLVSGEKWMELLNEAEDAAGTFLFWLDMHRFVAVAMDRLGALFLGAREVVGREVIAFVSRFPQIPSLTFADGSPFADPGTKSWLEEEGKKWGGSAGGGGSAASAAASAEDEEIAKRFEEAKEMVNGGKVGDGLAVAVALANRAADARMRFRAHLNVAKMALDGGKPELARPMLESLLAQVETHRLEVWEPSLCAMLYTQLLASHKSTKTKTPDAATKEAFLFDKLCQLDPAAALRLTGG